MHTYSLGGKKDKSRVTVLSVLFCISVVICTLINNGIEYFAALWPHAFSDINNFLNNWSFLDFSLGNISVFIIFGFIYWVFDKWIWNYGLIKKIIGIPDFSGVWKGELESSFDMTKTFKINMEIRQTWSKINIVSSFDDSESYSDSALIDPDHGLGKLLKFTYTNRAQNLSWDHEGHRGVNELVLSDYNHSLKRYMVLHGNYFNNRGKTGNKGIIKMRRVD